MIPLPPGPYAYWTTAPEGERPGKGHLYIVAQGVQPPVKLMALWGPPERKEALADIILKALNATAGSAP